jgi:uncharacterized protein
MFSGKRYLSDLLISSQGRKANKAKVRSILLEKHSRDIRQIARRHGVVRLRVFGSHASGQASATSDVDLLVQLGPDRDLLDLAEFKLDMEELLGCKVDVVTEAGLSPYLREEVLHTSKLL